MPATKPRPLAAPIRTTMNLAPELLARLDAWVESEQRRTGARLDRTQAVHMLLTAALDALPRLNDRHA